MHDDCIYKQICTSECDKFCVRYSEMSYLLKTSNLPKSQQCFHRLQPDNCDLPAFEKLADIQMNIEQFVNDGNLLYLYSKQVGNGKTTWMVKLLLQYFHEVWVCNGFTERGIFINVPTYLMQCKNAISTPDSKLPKIQNALMHDDLVILDDIAVTSLSAYDYSTLYGYIDSRLFANKAMFFTGNYAPEELKSILGERLASRIANGVVIELKGKDMRNYDTTSNSKLCD